MKQHLDSSIGEIIYLLIFMKGSDNLLRNAHAPRITSRILLSQDIRVESRARIDAGVRTHALVWATKTNNTCLLVYLPNITT